MSAKHSIAPLKASSAQTPFTLSAKAGAKQAKQGKPVAKGQDSAKEAPKPSSATQQKQVAPTKRAGGSTALPDGKKQKLSGTGSKPGTAEKKTKKQAPKAATKKGSSSTTAAASTQKKVKARKEPASSRASSPASKRSAQKEELPQQKIETAPQALMAVQQSPKLVPLVAPADEQKIVFQPLDVAVQPTPTTESGGNSSDAKAPSKPAGEDSKKETPPEKKQAVPTSQLKVETVPPQKKETSLAAGQTASSRASSFADKIRLLNASIHKTALLPDSLIKHPASGKAKSSTSSAASSSSSSAAAAETTSAAKRRPSKQLRADEVKKAHAGLVQAINAVFLSHQPMGAKNPRIVLEKDVLAKLADKQSTMLQELYQTLHSYILIANPMEDVHKEFDSFDTARVTKAINRLSNEGA